MIVEEESTTSTGNETQTSQDSENQLNTVWGLKLKNYISYILNGHCSEFKMTLEKTFKMITNKSSNISQDIVDLINYCLNIVQLENKRLLKFDEQDLKSIEYSFNEEALCSIIKTGYISKLIMENPISMSNLCVILNKFPTNKILSILLLIRLFTGVFTRSMWR